MIPAGRSGNFMTTNAFLGTNPEHISSDFRQSAGDPSLDVGRSVLSLQSGRRTVIPARSDSSVNRSPTRLGRNLYLLFVRSLRNFSLDFASRQR